MRRRRVASTADGGDVVVVLLRLTGVVLLQDIIVAVRTAGIRIRVSRLVVIMIAVVPLLLRTDRAESIVRIRGRVVGVGVDATRGEAAPLVELDVRKHGVAAHGVVVAPVVLVLAGGDVDKDGGQLRDERNDDERKQGLVNPTDHDPRVGAPVGRVTRGRQRSRHAPAQKAQRHNPDQEEARIEGEGERRGEAATAVERAREREIEKGQETRHHDLRGNCQPDKEKKIGD